MCNLYNITTNQEAIRGLSLWDWTSAGNLEPSLDVYPDRHAPIVRNVDGKRELARVRWGLPSSTQALFKATAARADKLRAKGKDVDFNELLAVGPDRGVTNVRNTSSKHWIRWLGVENRCVVPFTSFAEPNPNRAVDGEPNKWFARDETCPLMFFAGIWVPQWKSVRKIRDGMEVIDLFAFLTTDPNGIVEPIHPKAMPAILSTSDEVETWMTAPWDQARTLQRPLPDDMLTIVDAPPTQTEDEPMGTLL